MSKQALRKIAQSALRDFLASGRVVTRCPASRRSPGLRPSQGMHVILWAIR